MDGIAQIQRLGWEWRPDGIGHGTGQGVLLKVGINGQLMQVFLPLSQVWIVFDQELQRVGCPGAASVGAPFSVGGFFSFIKKAAKSIGRAAQRVVPKAIQRAASRVVSVAKKYGGKAISAAKTVVRSPILRGAVMAASFAVPALAPAAAALEIANRAADYYDKGIQAAKAIKAGIKNPALLGQVAQGLAAREGMQGIIQRATQGDARARQVIGAFQQGLVNQERRLPGGAQALQHAVSAVRSRPGLYQAMMARRGMPSHAAGRSSLYSAARRFA
jgi:hypothetical protein